mmetsp:Transcript_18129/g.26264  ORF Transcript_18129/g.26264 Transcript_18129/m.26264 type:complete len:413 (-) Transcript_18129:98-1336(-)
MKDNSIQTYTTTDNPRKKDNNDDRGWFCEECIREHNPNLDEIQGHRAFVSPGNYSIDSWDALIDLMVKGRRKTTTTTYNLKKRKRGDAQNMKKTTAHVPFRRRHGMPRVQPERMMLCTTDFRPSFVAHAVFAGFFPFGSEIECFPGKSLESRCLLNLELGGKGRLATTAYHNDGGGRVVLSDIVYGEGSNVDDSQRSPLPLHIGKKTIRALRKEPDSFKIRIGGSERKSLVNRLVDIHGVDWLGFDKIRALLESSPSVWDELPARLITIELLYDQTIDSTKDNSIDGNDGEAVISGEIGFLCGSCYMCLSLFNDKAAHPRCDRIRAEGAALLLSQAGVRLIDVGTSANYFEQFGFWKTTRREFVSLWRRWRSKPLIGNGGGQGLGLDCDSEFPGEELIRNMEAHRESICKVK